IILDWEKKDAPSGPEKDQKISSDRMRFFIEDAGYNVNRILRTNEFLYAFEIEKGENARKQSTFDFARLDY
ncbi:MAG: hypothetical protein KDK34_05040, partial [Leptospiraceae bacterium]|nr:hypothetical protein [Leptospiraceae bacterium]